MKKLLIFGFMKKYFIFFFILCLQNSHLLYADTIRMMQYNLMYYTLSAPVNCTVSQTYLTQKEENLKKIVQHAHPDVLCVNEIGSEDTYIRTLLANALNSDGTTHYAAVPLTNYSGGTIANMLYYDQRKLKFHSHFYVTTSYRDINAYKLYYNSTGLLSGDTVFITFIIAHLKAGTGQANEDARLVQVQKLMDRLSQIGKADNYVFSGDFNLYGASESAYQTLINYNNSLYRFFDPVDQEGEWHDHSSYALYHTQSTHSYVPQGECFSSGGMDDRFDFILVSPYIFYGSKGVRSLNETYHALGQDGKRLNRDLLSPLNTAVPEEVANALYNLSDHLPVILDFHIDATVGLQENIFQHDIRIVNPIQNQLEIFMHLKKSEKLIFEVYTIDGKKIDRFEEELFFGNNKIEKPFPYPSALYFINISDVQGNRIVRKVVK